MKRYFKLHNIVTLSLVIAVLFLVNANVQANKTINALNEKIESNAEAKLRLLGLK